MRYFIILISAFYSLMATFNISAADKITFNETEEPYFANKDYEVWINSIINDKDYTFVNITIYPKIIFRHWRSSSASKYRNDILSASSLKIIGKDSANNIISILPYSGLAREWASIDKIPYFSEKENESTDNLEKKELHKRTLRFGGNLKHSISKLDIIQDGEEYFSFKNVSISVPEHKNWDCKYTNEAEIINLINNSGDPICGIYEIEDEYNDVRDIYLGLRFACIKDGNRYNLICLDTSPDGVWRFGDLRASFLPTAESSSFKGIWKYPNKELKKEISFIINGAYLEAHGVHEYLNIVYKWDSFDVGTSFARISPMPNSVAYSKKQEEWSGTGFALLDGLIVTNNHVIEDAKQIKIYGIMGDFNKGFEAKVIARDKVCDIALLKLNNFENSKLWGNLPYTIKFDMAEVGEKVFALGYPLIGSMGEEVKLTDGIISSRSGFNGDVTTYQISVPIQPGNSGGPMFNENGDIIGIVCAKHMYADNAGYAIKSSYLNNLVECVIDYSVLPKTSTLIGLTLPEQIKILRNYVFLIKCSSE